MQWKESEEAYLHHFADVCFAFQSTRQSDITTFNAYIDENKNSIAIQLPESRDAIKVMTIHKSKGLEFPVVIVPYCNWNYYKANDNWVNITNEKVKLPVAAIHFSSGVKNAGFENEFSAEEQEQILENIALFKQQYF